MKSKISELAVFTIGVGILSVALPLYLNAMAPPNDQRELSTVLIGCIPGMLMLIAGIALAVYRTRIAIRVCSTVVIGLLALDVLLSLANAETQGPAVFVGILFKVIVGAMVAKVSTAAIQEATGETTGDSPQGEATPAT